MKCPALCMALCEYAALPRMMPTYFAPSSRFSLRLVILLIFYTVFMPILALPRLSTAYLHAHLTGLAAMKVGIKSEKALADALDAKNLPWQELPGEGAFYGPKIEFSLKDCIGRVWHCGTMQVDFSMPGRLDASYVDESGERQVPVMLHRAILGSFERFIGILIENFEGRLPLWLAPVQVVVMNITDKQADYVEKAAKVFAK